MERITLEQTWQLSTINFLNDLAFLKDRAKYEQEEQEKWRRKLKGKGS